MIPSVTELDKFNLVKIGYGGLVLGISQFMILPQLPQKMMLTTKVTQKKSPCFISLTL